MVALAIFIDFVVAMGYFLFAFVFVGVLGVRLLRWGRRVNMSRPVWHVILLALFGTFVFLLGCGGTHLEMVAHYLDYPGYAKEVAPHMVLVGLPQLLGVWGPILLAGVLDREFRRATAIKEKLDNGHTD